MERIREILLIFHDAINEIESLSDYYYRSNKTLISYKIEVEKNYSLGKKIADIFDDLFLLEEVEERNKRIEEIKDLQIDKNTKLQDVCEILPFKKDNQNSISFALKPQNSNNERFDPKKAKQRYEHIEKYEYIFVESILSHIIVSFETFLSNIYKSRLMAFPQKYLEGQTIPLAAIFSDSINDTIHEKLENEVTSKMYDSLLTIKWIADKEQISIDKYRTIANDFKEIYYRRNAYVHTKGKVNKDYLLKVDKKWTKDKEIDDDLICDDIYLKNAICIFSQIVFAVTFELLKKEKADENAIAVVANYYFEKLSRGEYQLTKYVYENLSKYSSMRFSDRLMYRINFLVAAKQLQDTQLVKHELEELDVSATESQFKIAKECLRDNHEKVFDMLNETYPDSFCAWAIKEWPIFIDFRKTEYYDKFIELHKEDFTIQRIDDNESEIDELLDKAESENCDK